MGPLLPWVMEIAKENMGLWNILCFLYQSIHYVLRYMLRAKVYKKLHSRNPNQPHSIEAEAFSSTSASFMPFACRVGSCHALSWRTKLSHCRGLQTSGWLQCTIKRQCAGPCRLVHRVTFHAQKVKESERVGSWIPCHLGSSLQADSCILGNACVYIQI